MKPLNLDNRPCSPVSSNCVVWQGPTLDCIDLCTGDTISDVVAKMAEELCTLLDQTNVDNYDLTCLGITACGPKDFQALIQLLIEKICELNDIPTNTTRSETDCPSCIVDIAQCFIQQTGQTTMPLVDYVKMIAEKVCGLVSTINNIQNEINDLTIRVEILENTPPPTVQIPTVNFSCNIGTLLAGQPYNVDVALQTYINSVWCPMSSALGTPSELIASYTIPCAFDSDITSNPNWTASPTNLADTITNIWITLCSLQASIDSISLTVQDTNSIDLTLTSGILTANIADTGWQPLNGFDFYAPSIPKPECRRIGNQIHFRGLVVVPLADPATPSSVVSFTSTSYNSIMGCATFTGGGGCAINSNGSIQFNNGTSVIPASILDPYVSSGNPGTNLDGSYITGLIIATRQIDLDPIYGTCLSSVVNVGITDDKKLYVVVLKDFEITNTRPSLSNLGTSHLRYLTSNVVQNQFVPDFLNPNTTIHSSPYSGDLHQTSLPAPLGPDNQYVNNLNVEYNTFRYPFDCNAGDENQIGGFAFKLDGLIAYVDPCTTDKKPFIDCK